MYHACVKYLGSTLYKSSEAASANTPHLVGEWWLLMTAAEKLQMIKLHYINTSEGGEATHEIFKEDAL